MLLSYFMLSVFWLDLMLMNEWKKNDECISWIGVSFFPHLIGFKLSLECLLFSLFRKTNADHCYEDYEDDFWIEA